MSGEKIENNRDIFSIPGEDVRRREVNFCTSRHPESSLPHRYLSSGELIGGVRPSQPLSSHNNTNRYVQLSTFLDRGHVDHCYQLAGLTDATPPDEI